MQLLPGFSKNIIQWYHLNKRDLPWRNTNDPYKIWVSEIILQQTRVLQGLPYYERFIATFPSVHDLAKAPIDQVLRLWQGLGYYSRARNMHVAAQYVSLELHGHFPSNFDSLLKMKGVGRYTAAAIASFAYKEKVAVVDGNVQRVLSRIFGISEDISLPKTQKTFEVLAQKHISDAHPDQFNQAIMEFGATYCMPHNPECNACIFKIACFAHNHTMVDKLPVKARKTKVKNRFIHYIVFQYGNQLAMKQRNEKDIWNGLFDFYLIESENEMQEFELNEHMKIFNVIEKPPYKVSNTFRHLLSHQRLHVKFYHYLVNEKQKIEGLGLNFYSLEETEKLPKPVLLANYLIEQNFI